MIVLLEKRPILTHAILKIPTGENITDNFRGGASGNQLGRVNFSNGQIEAVYGLQEGTFKKMGAHPDTGQRFVDLRIPDWHAYSRAVLKAASCFPGMRLQHWDVAVAEGGPVIIELNGDGCVQLPQVAYQRGFYSGAIKRAVLNARGIVPEIGLAIDPIPAG
jgi:hypothetical protein